MMGGLGWEMHREEKYMLRLGKKDGEMGIVYIAISPKTQTP